MKDKVLVEVIVPSIEENYDVYIPVRRKVGNVIELISKAIFELTDGIFINSEQTMLYDYETGNPYPIDVIIKDTTIRNGSKVILF